MTTRLSKSLRLRAESLEQRVLLAGDTLFVAYFPVVPDLSDVEFRTINGSGNNLDNEQQGAADTRVIRFGYPAVYPDGHGDVIDVEGRPGARTISNEIHAQEGSVLNTRLLTDWVFQWGQFLTHDMDLTVNGSEFNQLSDGSTGDFNIPVEEGDVLGPNPIPFNRSEFDPTTGTPDEIDTGFGPRPNWREQINQVTSYIDASNVYGSNDERAAALRTFVDGKLITSSDGLLPGLNDAGLPNDDPFDLGSQLYLAGDVRANETAMLTSVHSLFVREHNRLADRIGDLYPDLTDEDIYQLARRIVGAEIQIITYEEFLPALLGYDNAPNPDDASYDDDLTGAITNSFATAIFRFGHSMISEQTLLVDNDGQTVDTLTIDDAFFDPTILGDNPEKVELILKGLSSQLGQENDLLLVDGIRNNLFGPQGAGGLDLAALDIQRGRDHGLPDYNSLREFYGLERVTSFEEISSDPAIQGKLEELYGSIDNIDAFVGALAEDHLTGSSTGELVNQIIVNQFTRLRDGDRFFYTEDEFLQSRYVRRIINLDDVSLSQIIRWNTDITNIQDNVFFDESVLIHEVSQHGSNVTVDAGSAEVLVLKDRDGRVIERESLAGVSQVILVGSDVRSDTFTVDVAGSMSGLANGVVLYGRGGSNDVLRVVGTPEHDEFFITNTEVQVGDNRIEYIGFESLKIVTAGGEDVVQIADDVEADVNVVEPSSGHHNGSGHHHRPHHSDLAFDELGRCEDDHDFWRGSDPFMSSGGSRRHRR